ncbi:hypothetical protein BUALT_Bualt10G0133900 [Buddleja alternifolia]|uniref:Rad7 n=1 Tax=Buddleja alternifolia TaxID=168488 RepID=A0AAV6WXP6_9LAMI|nr:hypothetical protein BUALT_Bualt10G0133900 [Buddleja alternifolia]
MKRVIEIAEGESEDLGLKKVRLFNGNDENSGALEKNEGVVEGVFVDNGWLDSSQVEKTQDFFGNVVPDNLAGPSVGEMKESNEWDLDNINFDMFFSNEEQRKFFDMNVPVYRTENSYLEHNQGPVINDNRKEIIEIESDDSGDEVEIIGVTYGYQDKGKQIEFGLPYDNGLGDLSLGLGMFGMDNINSESGLVTGGERRYTREEKGKANVDDLWLSLNAFWPTDVDFPLPPDSNEPIRINEPIENVEVVVPVPVRPVLDERVVLNQPDEGSRRRAALYQENLRESAKRFARTVSEPSSQKQKLPDLEQLGNTPGPFSEALKMVRARTSKKGAHQLIEWKPSEENQVQSITEPIVPSLLDLSLRVLAENAERIVSLVEVPDVFRRRLTDVLCDTSKMNVHILNLLVKGCPDEIRIKNCSWLTETQFHQTFRNFQTKNLKVLQLDLCGQCMLDYAFQDTFSQSSNSFSRLAIVSLRGACRLSDKGLTKLVMSAPALQSINLGQCGLLTGEAINFIADYLGSNLRELYIDGCPKIDAMLSLPAFTKLKSLEVLSVAGVPGVTDQFVSEMITACGQSIKELDLANCLELTDLSLKTIGSSCADLCSLNISNLTNLTDLGLENLANGCKSIRKFKFCRNGFSDEAMAAFVESSGESLVELLLNNMTEVGPNAALSIAKRSRKLLSLDISWCRRISNEALGLIVDSCSSLKLLKVFGCRQITNVFVNGHSNRLVSIIGLNMTPILDHLNLLEPEEVFLRYSPLPICTEV